MSSRLFQSVREDAGLAYSIYSATEFNRDGGMLGIHLGVQPERGREALERVRTELERLAARGAPADAVQAPKAQLLVSLLMAPANVPAPLNPTPPQQYSIGPL